MKTESKYREALKELILTKPLEEITVQVLCDKVNTPRQTFYYHFRDIYDVINSIILEEKIDRSNEIKIQSIIKNTITYTNKNFQFLYSLMNSYAKDLIIEFYYSHFYKKIGENLTEVKYLVNPAIARDKELKELVMVLLTPEKSAVLVGKPGIGKTAIVEGLAYRIQLNDVPNALMGYQLYRINTPSLLGDYDGENRVVSLVNELKTKEKIIIFIDEIHTLIGNNAEGALDLANMFKEGLSRGTIKLIGATTDYEYERYILRDKAFVRRFEKIEIEEPTQEMCVQILMRTVPKIEVQTGVKLPYSDFTKEKIMTFIVDMTSEYKRVYEISSRYPDIALTILRQAFSQALYENRTTVGMKNIYDAISSTKAVYPDVIKKELVKFKEIFAKELLEEGVNI